MHFVFSCIFLLLILLAACNANFKAQLQPLKFITYTTDNGLLHNHVKKCVEDPKGFIWVITETGLSRFDGTNFKNFQNDESDPGSLPHNSIRDIAIENNGRIWLALENGLSYYNPKEDCFTSIDITGTYTKSPAVLAICADSTNQTIWFITDKALYGLSILDFFIRVTSCVNPTPTQINSMIVSSDSQCKRRCEYNG